MMDDVVGLVMVQVISNLGGGNVGIVTIIRPIAVSLGFALVAPVTCHLLVKPTTLALNRHRDAHPSGHISRVLRKRETAFIIHTMLLVALITGATYAGTSSLFAAYIAGASISWWDSEISHPSLQLPLKTITEKTRNVDETAVPDVSSNQITTNLEGEIHLETEIQEQNRAEPQQEPAIAVREHSATTGSAIYQHFFHQAVTKILQPFFFASIGFSIPITQMFSGHIVWRGIVYTALMTIAKLVCGFWLVRFSLTPTMTTIRSAIKTVESPSVPHLWGKKGRTHATAAPTSPGEPTTATVQEGSSLTTADAARSARLSSGSPSKPVSLHPPLIIALAMTARGEIGFLISAVAESKGIYSSSTDKSDSESDIFLIVTWAIVLCTIIGPLGVGLSVRRVKKLEQRKNRVQEGAGRDVLGVWGVD